MFFSGLRIAAHQEGLSFVSRRWLTSGTELNLEPTNFSFLTT